MPTSCFDAPRAHTISVPAGVRETILSVFPTVTSLPSISVTVTPPTAEDASADSVASAETLAEGATAWAAELVSAGAGCAQPANTAIHSTMHANNAILFLFI
ncbi:MAG: hypothetical protein DELT_03326 [Desulfovibrio sp.]